MVWGDAGWGGDGPAGLPNFDGAGLVSGVTSTSFVIAYFAGADVATEPADLVYEVHVARSPGEPFKVRAASAPGALSVLVDDLTPNTTYYARVRARNLQGITSLDLGPERAVVTPPDEPPTITNLSPAPGSALGPTDVVHFDVTDATGLRRVFVFVRIAGGGLEVAHDGASFAGAYVNSVRTPIANGYHYAVRRYGGWPKASVEFAVHAIDRLGTEG